MRPAAKYHAEPEGPANTNSGTGFARANFASVAAFGPQGWHADEMRRVVRNRVTDRRSQSLQQIQAKSQAVPAPLRAYP
jgi:hypothetical protein